MDDTIVTVEEQAEIIGGFLGGLLGAFHLEGEVHHTKTDDDTVELNLQGDDLALLIGPKGQTLTALHELSRTVLQRQATGRYEGRVRVDVSGYRMRRREALARFAAQVAEEVRENGVQKALEPMNSADRKVVHDTVNELEGVATRSDGQEPHRRVVIVPGSSD
jgi:spoIIIJ-associated protein